uniref:Uncharacterized protein n=1 Tax=Amphimedon queenslandica TaxID=400682 RepID=A0A1X7UR40_AMPQE
SPIAIPVDANGSCYVAGIVDVSCIEIVENVTMIVILKMTILIIIDCIPIRESQPSNGNVQIGASLY